MIAFIDDHRQEHGVEPICEVLPIALSTHRDPVAKRADLGKLSARAKRDFARLAELGRAVDFGCELVGFEQDDAGVTARIRTAGREETLSARYMVGADGWRSFVRHALGLAFPGKTLGVRAVVADVVADGIGRDAWHRWNEGSMTEQMSLCPLPGTDMFQLQAPVPLEGEVDTSVEGLTRMVHGRTGRGDTAVREVRWGSAYSMSARLADRYRVGRVFLVGHAAHTHPPTGGQGLNTSVQDAYNLGWKLGAVLGGAPKTLLDTYEEERRPIAAQSLAFRRGCSRRPDRARCGGGAKRTNSISAIPARRSPWRRPNARAVSWPATVRPMPW